MTRASFMLAAGLIVTVPSIAAPTKLTAGDAFPAVDADSVTGTHVALPADHRGDPFIAIFAFSQKSGDAAAQ